MVDLALPATLAEQLRRACTEQMAARFRPAGIGRQHGYQLRRQVRSDEICWLDGSNRAVADYLVCMEHLRSALNRALFLGLFEYECHFARYTPGACYRLHRDAFADQRSSRLLSSVLYLNRHWRPEQGGELVLYADDAQTLIETILPCHNRLVLFLSAQFPHEVKPATRMRYSLTGWFRNAREQPLIAIPPLP